MNENPRVCFERATVFGWHIKYTMCVNVYCMWFVVLCMDCWYMMRACSVDYVSNVRCWCVRVYIS